jgi:hypothetical protein
LNLGLLRVEKQMGQSGSAANQYRSCLFRVDGPTVGQFSVEHDSRLMPGLSHIQPIARLINSPDVSLVHAGIAHDQPNSGIFRLS